jgi:hypothetical protein
MGSNGCPECKKAILDYRIKLNDEKYFGIVGMCVYVFLLPAGACVVSSLLIVGWQCFAWLRSGHWFSVTVDDASRWMGMVDYPRTGWLGIDSLIDWTFASPVSSFAFILGIVLLWAFNLAMGPLDRRWRASIRNARRPV